MTEVALNTCVASALSPWHDILNLGLCSASGSVLDTNVAGSFAGGINTIPKLLFGCDVPNSARRSDELPGDYLYVSLSKPQAGEHNIQLSDGGLPVDDTQRLAQAICAMCQRMVTPKYIADSSGKKSFSNSVKDCQKSCRYYIPNE